MCACRLYYDDYIKLHDLLCLLYLLFSYIAAYESYAHLGLANSERIVCQITSDYKKCNLNYFFSMIA